MVKVAGRSKGGGGALAGRLGVRSGGGAGGVSDARQRIIQANRTKTGDARDKLAKLAKNTDARAKLEKIRGLRDGNLEVKQVGGITVTKKLDGKLTLSTKGKAETPASGRAGTSGQVTQIGRLTKTVSQSGQVVLSSKSAAAAAGRGGVTSSGMRSAEPRSRSTDARSQTAGGGGSVLRGAAGRGEKENMRRQASLRDIDSLDDELMTARVDPLLLKKTVENSRRQGAMHSRGERDRSPLRSRSPVRGRGFDYDDPRALVERESEIARRRAREAELHEGRAAEMTRGGAAGAVGVSPLQGTKVVIQNLQTSVTQEDVEELFGDIGALKKAKMIQPGHAEVVFVNRADAKKAVEIYHNRQLDGKPMKCQIVGANNPVAPGGATMKLPPSLTKKRDPSEFRAPIEIDTIHRALFLNKKNVGKKPLFTITMPKKSKEEDHRW